MKLFNRVLLSALTFSASVAFAEAEKYPVSPKFVVEDVEVLVTLADANRLHQCSILAYFPNAKFMFHKSVGGESGSDRSPGKLYLDWGGRSDKALTLKFDRYSSSTTWKVPNGALLKLLQAEGVEVPLEFMPQAEDKEEQNRQFVVALNRDTVTALHHVVPRVSKEQMGDSTVRYGSEAASVALLVQIGKPGKLLEKAKDLNPTLPTVANFKELSKEDKARAWQAGRKCFEQHFHLFGFNMTRTYDGPDSSTDEEDAGSYALTLHRSQTQGLWIIPTLDGKGTGKSPTGKVFSPVTVEQVDVNVGPREGVQALSSFKMSTARLFAEVLAPTLLEKNGGKLSCLQASSDYQSICTKDSSGDHWISVQGPDRRSAKNRFLVSDESETRIWDIGIQVPEQNPWSNMTGNFYPVKVAPLAAGFVVKEATKE